MLRFEYILLFVHCSLLFCRRRCGSHSDDRMDAHGTNHDLFASSFFQGTLLATIGLKKHNYMVKQLQMNTGICFNAKSYAFPSCNFSLSEGKVSDEITGMLSNGYSTAVLGVTAVDR